jgi:mitochondrial translocator assembly and maintenance protein 41
MRFLGSGAISWLQDKSGAGVYFNPYVEVNGMVRPSLDEADG